MLIYLLVWSWIFGLNVWFSSADTFEQEEMWYHHESDTTGISQLVASLIEGADDDSVRLDRIFEYVTGTITYDREAYRAGNKRINQSISEILERKRAVCWGFSQLITVMCREAGIRSWSVVGYTHSRYGIDENFDYPDHAWNVVELDGKYALLDATWAEANPTDRDRLFRALPREFIQDHFPVLPMFQLLPCPVSFEEFVNSNVALEDRDSCHFSVRDSIRAFAELTYVDQKVKESRVAMNDNPSEKNRSNLGHTLLDRAVVDKEAADSLMDNDQATGAPVLYGESLSDFRSGKKLTTLYPWQQEAFGFAWLNYGMSLYRNVPSPNKSDRDQIVTAFKEAHGILSGIEVPGFAIKQAISMIEENLAILE